MKVFMFSELCTAKVIICRAALRVVRDVDKAENCCGVTFIIVQSYAEELETDILEQG